MQPLRVGLVRASNEAWSDARTPRAAIPMDIIHEDGTSRGVDVLLSDWGSARPDVGHVVSFIEHFDVPVVVIGALRMQERMTLFRAGVYDVLPPGAGEAQVGEALAAARASWLADNEVEEELEELQERAERMHVSTRAIAHDLRSPLAAIRNALQIVREDEDLTDAGLTLLDAAIDSAEGMAEYVDMLMDYARLDDAPMRLEPVNLQETVDEVMDMLAAVLEDVDGRIVASGLPTVHGDPALLRVVLKNLLSNAIKYRSPRPPFIRVTARQSDAAWIISVHDNGRGIAPEDRERIFDAFERAGDGEGSGLGLSLCRKIVERHGGGIWVRPRKGGSIFEFTVPVKQVTA